MKRWDFNCYKKFTFHVEFFCHKLNCLLLRKLGRVRLRLNFLTKCSSRKYPNSPTEGIGISLGLGDGGLLDPNIERNAQGLKKISRGVGGGGISIGVVWIISGITRLTQSRPLLLASPFGIRLELENRLHCILIPLFAYGELTCCIRFKLFYVPLSELGFLSQFIFSYCWWFKHTSQFFCFGLKFFSAVLQCLLCKSIEQCWEYDNLNNLITTKSL